MFLNNKAIVLKTTVADVLNSKAMVLKTTVASVFKQQGCGAEDHCGQCF